MGVLALACAPASPDSGSDGDDQGGAVADAAPGGAGADASSTTDSPDAAACASSSVSAETAVRPVDIIWVVDSSGSMDDEAAAVQDALNDFSAFIDAQSIDYRVILVGDAGAMAVPPPLGGSPEFLHVDQDVGSTNALQVLHDSFAQYQSFLRDDAVLHIVVVTDDESNWSHAEFDANIASLPAPGLDPDYTLHSICSESTVVLDLPPLPPIMGPCSGGLGVGGAADIGQTYIDMSAATGGVWRSICTSDWAPIFTAVAEAVSVGVALPCVFDLPPPPEGETLDPNRVNFVFTPSGGGSPATIPRVDNAGACGGNHGWYYDDPATPTQILVCPHTCDALSADTDGQVDIQFGCATVVL